MSTYLLWSALSAIFGSPIVGLLVALVVAWFLGRRLFFPSRPRRWLSQRRHLRQLRFTVTDTPWNRAARFELADLLVDRRKFAEALEVLRPNLDRDDDDDTLFLMGVASYGVGDVATGERLLGTVVGKNPGFKVGQAWLELGRHRLAHDPAAAVSALERFIQYRSSTVEGRVLLARAFAALGDATRAAALRRDAWRAYLAAPRFLRKKERAFAYSVKPLRAAAWVAAAAVVTAGVLIGVGQLASGASLSREYLAPAVAKGFGAVIDRAAADAEPPSTPAPRAPKPTPH